MPEEWSLEANFFLELRQENKNSIRKKWALLRAAEGNRSNWPKKKTTLHVQHTFKYISLLCFARLQRETSRNVLVICFMKDMSYVFGFFLFTYFFTAAYSHLGGR